ncbi:MAG: AMP-binding protein [Propionibacteriales bacterium]|nr:AMP-binding protein [Propionibacteriales bacterium]
MTGTDLTGTDLTGTAGTRSPADRLGRFEPTAAPAVVVGDRVISHAELDDLVGRRATVLGPTRRLVLLECANALEPLVTYLAALRGHHPVLLAPSLESEPARRQWQRIVEAYRPDLICARDGDLWVDLEEQPGTRHDLHPELAVLLGTSGSTGTPKLVRLSRENLRSNAAAIADYLHLDQDSRAATTLPLQYCYGLSVVNSHLMAQGSVWLTDASVVDPGFWDDFEAVGATSLAGVPYTFDLLARSGVDWLAVPGLRQVTQAGGRMDPDRVRDVAVSSQRHGVEFFVMYGQTEATARMAYLPPGLAAERPSCIGVPIDGGEFALDDGELVYSGPNVMLGYAEGPADLALGATLTELRTGDRAVQHDDGLFEIVGRSSRLAKLYGVRLDLDLAEQMLAERGVEAAVVVAGEQVHVFVGDARTAGRAHGLVAQEHCLPRHAVVVHAGGDLPRTASGKVDLGALERRTLDARPAAPDDVRSAYAGVFGREVGDDDSFVSLHGDSLSYVETFTRLERLLGTVPARWPELSVADLSARSRRPRRTWAALETPMVLRAAAIVLLLGAHADLWTTQGGAHVLLALFGFNLARFALVSPVPRERLVAVLRLVGDMVAPALLLIVVVIACGGYRWPTALLLNSFVGYHETWGANWQLWFLEATAWTAVTLAALLCVPGIRAVQARWPYAAASGALGIAMVLRATLAPDEGPRHLYSPQASAWCILLGVLAAYADTRAKKVLTVALAVACTLGYFAVPLRGYLVVGAVVLVLALPWVPVPRPLDRVVATVASASLFIYLTHWRFYEPLEESVNGLLALVASIVVGVVAWAAWNAGRRRLASAVAARGPATS